MAQITVCDICGERIIHNCHEYKIKIKERVDLFEGSRWHKMAICDKCQNKIINLIKEHKNV